MLPLAELNESWLAELHAARRSDATIKVYRDAWAAYTAFCDTNDLPVALTKPDVLAFITDQTTRCSAPTASLRLTALKVFARWLAAEEGFDAAPMLSVPAPKIDERVIDHLTDTQLRALITACNGTDIRDLRDKALVSMFAETGLRASEMLSLTIEDVSISQCMAVLRKGKGGKARRVKFSPQTAVLIDRYLRARRRAGNHPTAHGGRLWLSGRGPLYGTGRGAARPRRQGRYQRLSFTPHSPYDGGALAGRRRIRDWTDGPGRVAVTNHDRPLHQECAGGSGRRRVRPAQPRVRGFVNR